MKNKEYIVKEIYIFHIIQWINHIFEQILKGIFIFSLYFFIKSIFYWKTSTMFFYKYQQGIITSIFFYIFLKILRYFPSMKKSIEKLDSIIGYNRISAFWQFKESKEAILKLLINDCMISINKNMKPKIYYLKVKPLILAFSAFIFMGSILVNTFPDEFKYERDEKIIFNEEIKEKINEIFYEEKELSTEEKNMKSDIMLDSLIKDLENSYTEKEAISYINEFEKSFLPNAMNGKNKELLKSMEATDSNFLNEDIAMEENSSILDRVRDAVKNQRKEQAVSGNSNNSLTEGFSELLDKNTKDSDDIFSDGEILSSEAKGNMETGKEDGQGGSGISYEESKSEFEESPQYRDSSEKEVYDSGEEVIQISNGNSKETHIVKASGIEEIKNGEKIYSSSSGEVIKSGDKVIINIQGIPKERMNIVKEYYKGE